MNLCRPALGVQVFLRHSVDQNYHTYEMHEDKPPYGPEPR